MRRLIALVLLFLLLITAFSEQFQLFVVILIVGVALRYIKGTRKKMYTGFLGWTYIIALLQLSTNYLVVSWLTVTFFAFELVDLVTLVWIWSIVAATLLWMLSKSKNPRIRRAARA